jgi:hypothetical protein
VIKRAGVLNPEGTGHASQRGQSTRLCQ